MSDRVIVFIDAQNIYRAARRTFFASSPTSSIDGNIYPYRLGNKVTDGRELVQVRTYDGLPSASRQPKAYSAHMKRINSWKSAGVEVITRPLRYRNSEVIQKGIDVLMAIDIVTLAIEDKYDVAILASMDTDLIPPLEYVADELDPSKTIEVVAWTNGLHQSRLRIRGKHVRCHWLDKADYDNIADTTKYS